jgi:LysM repeat protein
MTQVQINRTQFIADVNAGMTRNELKAKYQVPVTKINDWAKGLGLNITIKKAPKYVLIDDSEMVETTTTTELTEQEFTAGF